MGNDQSSVGTASTSSLNNAKQMRRESASVAQNSQIQRPGSRQGNRNCRQRRMSTCGAELSLAMPSEDMETITNFSPRQTAFRTSRPQSQLNDAFTDDAEPEEPPQHPLTPFPCIEPRRIGSIPPQTQIARRQLLLAPTGGSATNCRNRRMSVAGDQQEALRRELARAEGHTISAAGMGTGSGGSGTPARRFSRATANGAGGAGGTAPLARKISELGAGAAGCELSVHELLKLSSYQLHILQQSWPRIRSSGVFVNAFKDLAHKNAGAKELFQKMSIVEGFSSGGKKCCDQKEHGRQLSELFELAVQNLNGPARIVQQKCQAMGEQHFSVFGASNEAQLWDDLGESISQAMAKTEPVRGKREAFRAWITLANFLVESMRAAYVAQHKRRSVQRHSSSSQLQCAQQLTTLQEQPLQEYGTLRSPSAASVRGVGGDKQQRPLTPTVPLGHCNFDDHWCLIFGVLSLDHW